jgi:hypothetical protein
MNMTNPRAGGDPEMVVRQAMRAMAGGRRPDDHRPYPPARRRLPLTAAQIMLIAAILGVVAGMAVAFVLLLG